MAAGLSRRAVVGAAAACAAWPALPAQAQDGVVARLKTDYNDIVVRRIGGRLAMNFIVGRCEFTESIYDPGDPALLPVEYTRAITAALVYPPRLGSILEIGLGGGRVVSYLAQHVPSARITAVEIDAAVVALAKAHFGVTESERLRIVVADGRKHLAETRATHDLILVDAYRGTWVPETLTTVEFFELVKSRLNRGGAVAQNVEPTTLFFDGMAATLKAVFAHVDLYETVAGNAVLVAYDGPAKSASELAARAARLQERHRFRHPLPGLVAGRKPAPTVAAAPLRDGFERANTLLMIDRANDPDTPRQRSERCKA